LKIGVDRLGVYALHIGKTKGNGAHHERENEMTTYTIAMIGDMLAATAVDGDDAMMADRLADTMTQVSDGDSTDVEYITGLTLYTTTDDAETDGAEIIYSGNDMGWLQDASGKMNYMAAGRK